MTKQEAVIIMAYTGTNMGCLDEYYVYIKKLLGHPVFTHQTPQLAAQIKEKAEPDFIRLCNSIEE